jgi:glycosyltransferase involved in cell wall biosynthesis
MAFETRCAAMGLVWMIIDMTTLCYITTCKGRLHHLRQTLPRVVDQPDVSCVVVDYACPDHTTDWVVDNFPQVKVVQVTDEAGFNASRARNLGAQAAEAPWLAFFDADILWAPDLAKTLIPQLRTGHFYRAQPVTQQTWGSVICHRQDFDAIGGYDEAFTGWGGEDDDLLARLTLLGRIPAGFPSSLVGEIPHDDAARVRFYDVKDKAVQHRVNMLYVQIKLDLFRLMGEPLALEARRTLANEVKRVIRQAVDSGQEVAHFEVNLPAQLVKPPPANGLLEHWHLNRKLAYSIDIAARYIERV